MDFNLVYHKTNEATSTFAVCKCLALSVIYRNPNPYSCPPAVSKSSQPFSRCPNKYLRSVSDTRVDGQGKSSSCCPQTTIAVLQEVDRRPRGKHKSGVETVPSFATHHPAQMFSYRRRLGGHRRWPLEAHRRRL